MTRPTTAAKGQPYPARHRHRVKITAPEICDSLHSLPFNLCGVMCRVGWVLSGVSL